MPNLAVIGQNAADIQRSNSFQNGGSQPSWISTTLQCHRVQAGNIALGAGELTAITQTHSWLQWVEPTRKVKEGKERNDQRERGNEQVDRER